MSKVEQRLAEQITCLERKHADSLIVILRDFFFFARVLSGSNSNDKFGFCYAREISELQRRQSFKPEPGKLVQEHLYLYLCISPYIHPYVHSVNIYYTCSFVNTWNSLWPLTRTINFWRYRSIFCLSSSPQPVKTEGCPPQSVSARGFFLLGSFSSPLSRHAWLWRDPLVFLFDCANHFETPLNQQSWSIADVYLRWRIPSADNRRGFFSSWNKSEFPLPNDGLEKI